MIDIFEILPKRIIDSDYAGQILVGAIGAIELVTASAVELVVGKPNEMVNAVIYGGGMGIVGSCAVGAAMLAGLKKNNTTDLGN